MKPLGFDWDDRKAASNLANHRVSFDEATSVFDDGGAATREDPDHSLAEHREIIIGFSNAARLLFVSFTEQGDVIRLINARVATHLEQKLYEENRR
jgi:uncharacterized DUF497 family protein